jgi:hypothetical protein
MQQGGGMDEFDDGRQVDMLVPAVIAGVGSQQDQNRAQALATTINNVVLQLVDQGNITGQAVLYQFIDGLQIPCDQLPERFNVCFSLMIFNEF